MALAAGLRTDPRYKAAWAALRDRPVVLNARFEDGTLMLNDFSHGVIAKSQFVSSKRVPVSWWDHWKVENPRLVRRWSRWVWRLSQPQLGPPVDAAIRINAGRGLIDAADFSHLEV